VCYSTSHNEAEEVFENSLAASSALICIFHFLSGLQSMAFNTESPFHAIRGPIESKKTATPPLRFSRPNIFSEQQEQWLGDAQADLAEPRYLGCLGAF